MVYAQVAPSLTPKLIIPKVNRERLLALNQEVPLPKPKPVKKKKVAPAPAAPVKPKTISKKVKPAKKAPKPHRFERIEYRVKKVAGKGPKPYACACGCGQKVKKLFAKGHVSRFVKIMTDESLDVAIKILKDVRARIVPEKRHKKKA